MPRQTASRSTSRQVKMTVMGPTMAGLLRIQQDRLNAEWELDMQARGMFFC